MAQFLKTALLQRFAVPPISEAKRGLENLAWFQRKVCSSCLFCQSLRQVFDGETANLWWRPLHIAQKERMFMYGETDASSLFGNLVESFWMDS
jgi:hypothetical protein